MPAASATSSLNSPPPHGFKAEPDCAIKCGTPVHARRPPGNSDLGTAGQVEELQADGNTRRHTLHARTLSFEDTGRLIPPGPETGAGRRRRAPCNFLNARPMSVHREGYREGLCQRSEVEMDQEMVESRSFPLSPPQIRPC